VMALDLVQHAIVTLAAVAAGWVVVRRVVGAVKPAGGGAPKCSSCPAARPPTLQKFNAPESGRRGASPYIPEHQRSPHDLDTNQRRRQASNATPLFICGINELA